MLTLGALSSVQSSNNSFPRTGRVVRLRPQPFHWHTLPMNYEASLFQQELGAKHWLSGDEHALEDEEFDTYGIRGDDADHLSVVSLPENPAQLPGAYSASAAAPLMSPTSNAMEIAAQQNASNLIADAAAGVRPVNLLSLLPAEAARASAALPRAGAAADGEGMAPSSAPHSMWRRNRRYGPGARGGGEGGGSPGITAAATAALPAPAQAAESPGGSPGAVQHGTATLLQLMRHSSASRHGSGFASPRAQFDMGSRAGLPARTGSVVTHTDELQGPSSRTYGGVGPASRGKNVPASSAGIESKTRMRLADEVAGLEGDPPYTPLGADEGDPFHVGDSTAPLHARVDTAHSMYLSWMAAQANAPQMLDARASPTGPTAAAPMSPPDALRPYAHTVEWERRQNRLSSAAESSTLPRSEGPLSFTEGGLSGSHSSASSHAARAMKQHSDLSDSGTDSGSDSEESSSEEYDLPTADDGMLRFGARSRGRGRPEEDPPSTQLQRSGSSQSSKASSSKAVRVLVFQGYLCVFNMDELVHSLEVQAGGSGGVLGTNSRALPTSVSKTFLGTLQRARPMLSWMPPPLQSEVGECLRQGGAGGTAHPPVFISHDARALQSALAAVGPVVPLASLACLQGGLRGVHRSLMAGPSPRLTPPPHALLSAMLASFTHGMGLPAPALLTPPSSWSGGPSTRTALPLRSAVEAQLQQDLWNAIQRGSAFEGALPPDWLHVDTPHVLPIVAPSGDKQGAKALHAIWAHAAFSALGHQRRAPHDLRKLLSPGGVVEMLHTLLLKGVQGGNGVVLAAEALSSALTGLSEAPFTPLMTALRCAHPAAAGLRRILQTGLVASDARALAGVLEAQDTLQGLLSGHCAAAGAETASAEAAALAAKQALESPTSLVVAVAPPGVVVGPRPPSPTRAGAPTARSFFQAAAVKDALRKGGGEGGVRFTASPCGRPYLTLEEKSTASTGRKHVFLPLAEKGIVISARGQELPYDPLYTSAVVPGGDLDCDAHPRWKVGRADLAMLSQLGQKTEQTSAALDPFAATAVQAALFRLTPGVPDSTLIVESTDTPFYAAASPVPAVASLVPATAQAATPVRSMKWGAFAVQWVSAAPPTTPASPSNTAHTADVPAGFLPSLRVPALRAVLANDGSIQSSSGTPRSGVIMFQGKPGNMEQGTRMTLSITSLGEGKGGKRDGGTPPRTSSMGILGADHDILLPRHRPRLGDTQQKGKGLAGIRSRGASAGFAQEVGPQPLRILREGGDQGAAPGPAPLLSRLRPDAGAPRSHLAQQDQPLASSLASASYSSSLFLEHFEEQAASSTPAGGIGTPMQMPLGGGGSSSSFRGGIPSSASDLGLQAVGRVTSGDLLPRSTVVGPGALGGGTHRGPGTTATADPREAIPPFAILTPHKSTSGGGCVALQPPFPSCRISVQGGSGWGAPPSPPSCSAGAVFCSSSGAGALLDVLESWGVHAAAN